MKNQDTHSQSDSISKSHSLVLFLLWPFLGLLFAMLNWKSDWAKNIAWLFCGFYGFTFVISNDGMDANRYRDSLIELHNSNLTIWEYLYGVWNADYSRGDYVEPMIRYVVSCLTDDYRVLFLCFGLFMGFFMTRNIWFLLSRVPKSIDFLGIPFLVIFLLIVPFWSINGFRFWSACHVFFYGVISILFHKQYLKGLFILGLAISTHISFVLPCVIFAGFFLIPESSIIYFVAFIVSIFLINLDSTKVYAFVMSLLGDKHLAVFQDYFSEEYFEKRERGVSNVRWYVRYQFYSIYLYTLVVSGYLLLEKRVFSDRETKQLFLFGLLLFCTVNTINVIPSIGRFYLLSYLFIFGTLFLLATSFRFKHFGNGLLSSFIFFSLIPIMMQIRIGMDFIGPNTFVLNPMFVWLVENDIAFSTWLF